MNSKTWARIIALALFATLAMPVQMAGQDKAKTDYYQYHHYQISDPGTFGGPSSYLYNGVGVASGFINNRGTLVGAADTLTLDPYCLDSPDCYAAHAFQLQNGVTTDLGVLPGGVGSQVGWISPNGLMVGVSDNGQADPLSGGTLPQIHGVLWEHGDMTDLGTLGGGYFSFTEAVNSRGEVVGWGQNTIPDPNSMLTGYGYQSRAFLWDKQSGMQDLGTLPGGTDAGALFVNERGQVTGWSYNSSNPNLDNLCFSNSLTTGSFIWDRKNGMKDIGNLGGTSCTLTHDLNNRGQIVGGSDVPGEFQHPFVWDSATGMTDLGTPDGGYGVANAINEHGDVVGLGSNGVFHAMLWRRRGGKWKMTDLGTLNGGNCGFALSINASGQVVGISGPDNCSLPFLWEDGGPLVDLNTLVPPNSGLQLFESAQINDRGEIDVLGTDANGNNHAVILVPCDDNHPDVEGCDYSMVDAATLQPSVTPAPQPPAARTPPSRMPAGLLNRLRSRWGQRTPVSGTVPEPAAKQSLPVNTDSVDLEDEYLLAPLAGHHAGYCGVSGSKLNGYCVAYSYYSCLAKASTACPSGQVPRKPGYFQCDNNYRRYVDLGRGCGF